MAIQNRRGNYTDFDPTKMVAGEFAVVQNGDPDGTDGEAVYYAPKAGKAKRLVTADDVRNVISGELEDIIAETEAALADDVQRAEDAADSVESSVTQIATNTADIADIKEDLKKKSGLSEEAKVALLDCFEHVAWIDAHGQDYYDALYDALYHNVGVVRIEAVYTQGSTVVYPTTPLSDLKANLVVTAYYNDGTSERITDYALSGTLEEGTSTITVTYSQKTATFTVVVSAPYWDYEWSSLSGELPTGLQAESYNFTDESGVLHANKPNLDLSHIGNCVIEITAKELVKRGAEILYKSQNNPQCSIINEVVSNGVYRGIKLIFNYGQGTSDTHGNIGVGINGTNTFIEGVNSSEYNTYKITAQNNVYSLLINGEPISLEQNNNTTAYLNKTGIVSTDLAGYYYSLFIKSIKFKKL